MKDREVHRGDSTCWHALTAVECLQELGTAPAGLGDEEAQAGRRGPTGSLSMAAAGRCRYCLITYGN